MDQSNNLFELQVDHQATAFLRETAKWAKFLSIVGFVIMSIVLLAIIFAGSTFRALMSAPYADAGAAGAFAGTMLMVVMVVMMLIYFIPTWYLFKFATRMQVALRNNDQVTLNSSFESLKSCFKFVGILTIIILCIYGLLFVIGLLAGVASMA